MSGLKGKGVAAAAVAVACLVSVPAQATMGCWNQTQVAAAQVRDLQSRLMVATLRCQGLGMDITAAYNRFVVANRTTIQGANNVIMAQFRSGVGPEAQRHYDSFATSLANAYGGDATDRAICAQTEMAADEAAGAAGDIDRLVALENRLGVMPPLPGGQCEVRFGEVQASPVSGAAKAHGLETWHW
jgi:hypothetical protein